MFHREGGCSRSTDGDDRLDNFRSKLIAAPRGTTPRQQQLERRTRGTTTHELVDAPDGEGRSADELIVGMADQISHKLLRLHAAPTIRRGRTYFTR